MPAAVTAAAKAEGAAPPTPGPATPTPAPAPAAAAAPAPAKSSQQDPAISAAGSPVVKKDVRAFGDKVGETIALIRRCLNVGIAAPPAEGKPAAPSDADATAAAADDAASCELVARSAGNLVTVKAKASFLDNIVATVLGAKNVAGARSIRFSCSAPRSGSPGSPLRLVSAPRASRRNMDRRAQPRFTRARAGDAVDHRRARRLRDHRSVQCRTGRARGVSVISGIDCRGARHRLRVPDDFGTHPQYQGLGGCDDSGRVRGDTEGFLASWCFSAAPLSGLETRVDPTQASIADVFMGKDVGCGRCRYLETTERRTNRDLGARVFRDADRAASRHFSRQYPERGLRAFPIPGRPSPRFCWSATRPTSAPKRTRPIPQVVKRRSEG